MCVRGGIWGAIALTALFGACEHEEIGYLPESEMSIGRDVAAEPSDVASPDTDDGPDTDGGPAPTTGIACEADEDCETDFCLNNEFLGSLGLTLEVPGGMCSVFPCFDDSECGAGALCVDGAPFGAEGISLCLATCGGMSDCRWQEGWSCFDASDVPTEGAPAEGAETPLEVCLPDNIIVEAESAADEREEAR